MRLKWVLMDIAKQSEEIIPVANRLALETLLKEITLEINDLKQQNCRFSQRLNYCSHICFISDNQ